MAPFPAIDALAAALAGRTPPAADGIVAAVMLCVRDLGAGTEILLCRRAERDGDPWSGHMSLPGGRLDPGETPLAAAVRETIEEVGFHPLDHGELLGPLDPLHGHVNTVPVAPFAALVRTAVEPTPSDELAAAWWAVIDTLEERRVRVREVPYLVPALVGSGSDGREAVVWGMTYRLLESARELVAAVD
jgi:8-oxo-dGTP pyrophosphatase MutT (NUDIX family)